MLIKEIISIVESIAPPGIQEGFDNSGLICGDSDSECHKLLLCLDLTEDVILEAIEGDYNLIVAHHPLIFKGIKRITPTNPVGRVLLRAIKNDIAIYAAHTSFDKVIPGVSTALANRIGLKNQRILVQDHDSLLKITTYIPTEALDEVAGAMFAAGAGQIGDYDSCSYRSNGSGSFRALDSARPYVGNKNEIHLEPEVRFEAIVQKHKRSGVVRALIGSHPYEEVAYDLVALENANPYQGLGIVGDLDSATDAAAFLKKLKKELNLSCIRCSGSLEKNVSRIAVCGGSGSEFLGAAKASGAQVYISGDFKYHQFFDHDDKILIADIGHYESEILSLELLKQLVTKKITNFAVHLSEVNTNPIKYL